MPSFVPSHTALPFAWHSGTCPKARIYVPVDIWECHKWTKSTKTSRPKRRPGKFMCVCLNLQVVTGGQKSCPPGGRLNHKVFGEKSKDTILNTKPLSIGALVKADISHCCHYPAFFSLWPSLIFWENSQKSKTNLHRPHHRLQQQQHRSLFYILPCVLLAVVVNIPKFFETETVT